MSDAHREMGEYLIEDHGGIVFETPGNAAAELEAHLDVAPKYQPGSIGAMFPQAAELMEGLLAERNRLEVQLAEAIAQRDQARGMVVELENENAELLDLLKLCASSAARYDSRVYMIEQYAPLRALLTPEDLRANGERPSETDRRVMVERDEAVAELAHATTERDAALLAAEVATGTPCWRCGGAA